MSSFPSGNARASDVFPAAHFRSIAGLCVAVFRKHGMRSSMNMLLESARLLAPVCRINGVFVGRDGSSILNIFDTQPNDRMVSYYLSPTLTASLAAGRMMWIRKHIIRPEDIDAPLLINDLAPYKTPALLNNPLCKGIPYLSHQSLVRLPLFAVESFVFAINFWADVTDAFAPDHVGLLQELVSPLGQEWRENLGSSGPAIQEGATGGDDSCESGEASRSFLDGYVKQLENCPGLRPVCELVRKVARTDATVIIQGETGVGKEFVACAIHEQSARKGKPFVAVNCGAIPANLVESELFGHERGAFTGAVNRHKGYFEQAAGGTVFLDEIGDLPLDAQVKLLRVLEKGHVVRVGGNCAVSLDVRIIVATNADLEDKMRQGTFRRDLWYRLAVFPLYVPPLRERPGDIPHLLRDFLAVKARALGIEFKGSVSEKEIRRLYAHDWPGNVRELEHVVERSLILHGDESGPLHFALSKNQGAGRAARAVSAEADSAQKHHAKGMSPLRSGDEDWPSLRELEGRYIRKVLEKSEGRLLGAGGALSILGIHYSTLRARMLSMGLPLPREARKRAFSGTAETDTAASAREDK